MRRESNPWRVGRFSHLPPSKSSPESYHLYTFFLNVTISAGVMETGVTVTAAAVIQLLSPVFSFLLQLVLFPHIVWWRSGVGILSIILAVMVQLRVLKKREKEIAKSQVIRSCLTEDIQLV